MRRPIQGSVGAAAGERPRVDRLRERARPLQQRAAARNGAGERHCRAPTAQGRSAPAAYFATVMPR